MNVSLFFWLHNLTHHSAVFDRIIIFIADTSDKIVFALVAIFFAVLFLKGKDWKEKRWKEWLREIVVTVSSVGGAWLVSEVIKQIVKAPRPFIVFPWSNPLFLHGGYDSFPSGHATVFFALAVIMYEYHKGAGIVCFIVAILIALSRVIAGIHFPVDILVGAVIGIIIGRLVFMAVRKISRTA